MKKIVGLAALAVVLLFSSFKNPGHGSVTINGVILSENGKPLSGVLVYVTAGEEEALTKEKGEFSIETIRKAPFVVTAEHWEYQKATVTVTDPGKKITIRLTRK